MQIRANLVDEPSVATITAASRSAVPMACGVERVVHQQHDDYSIDVVARHG
ncbi:hypothetical protein [Kineococcus radiotolerans]|uniref:hypothetical protein n=1 Tax=Kineococcus radiotolerans TaxID=131568 RepID=UPI0012FEA3D0|nr:hypothetical protein [Kineococcus radiotolerans]